MNSIENFRDNLKNPILNKEVKGFLNQDSLNKYKENTRTEVIPFGMSYRPDLIANYFLGDPTAGWIIMYVNNFLNGIKDLEEGKKILIPNEA